MIFQTSEQDLPAVAVAVPTVCLARACDKSMRWAHCHPWDGGRHLQRGSPQSPFPGGASLSPRTWPHNVWETTFLLRREFVLLPRRSVISCRSRKSQSTLATSPRKQDGLWSSKRMAQDFSAEEL